MKNQSLKKLVRTVFTAVFLFIAFFANAQTDGPGSGLDVNPDAGVPLDGGVTLLLVMAVCYVAFKVWQYRKISKFSSSKD
jgi:hypothetical protein